MFRSGSTVKIECLNLVWTWYEHINNIQVCACYKV